MDIYFADYLDRLGDLHRDCRSAIDGLPQEAIDWTPTPEMNSIGVLIVHIAGAERYWFGEAIAKEPSNRDREGEFKTRGLDPAELSRKLEQAYYYIEDVLAGMKFEDLSDIRNSPRDGQEVTVGWSMLHVLKHTALHLGHIEATRHMWEMGNAS